MTSHATIPPSTKTDAGDMADAALEAKFERRMTAITAAVDTYHTYLHDYLLGLCGQWQDAENLLQDLWHYVLLHFEDDQIDSVTLLRRKAYQLFIDHYRRQIRRGETLSETPLELPVRPMTAEASNDAEEQALKECFWANYPEIDLTDAQKHVLWLHARYGFTHKEIEAKTGTAASTVGDWIRHGRKCLAEAHQPNTGRKTLPSGQTA